MMTRKSDGLELTILIQPTFGLKRVESDLALLISICFFCIRAFRLQLIGRAEAQYIIKPGERARHIVSLKRLHAVSLGFQGFIMGLGVSLACRDKPLPSPT